MDYLVTGLKIIIVIGLGIGLNVLLLQLINRLHQKELIPNSMYVPLRGLLKGLLLLFILLLLLQQLGISVSRVFTALSAVLVLVAVGFVAFWSILTNILSSFLLVVFSPFRIGDTIELREPEKEKGTIGKVVDLNVFYTTLVEETDSDEGTAPLIRIPNSLFFQRIIICHAGSETKSLKTAMSRKTDEGA